MWSAKFDLMPSGACAPCPLVHLRMAPVTAATHLLDPASSLQLRLQADFFVVWHVMGSYLVRGACADSTLGSVWHGPLMFCFGMQSAGRRLCMRVVWHCCAGPVWVTGSDSGQHACHSALCSPAKHAWRLCMLLLPDAISHSGFVACSSTPSLSWT